jgi:hypothetical protein
LVVGHFGLVNPESGQENPMLGFFICKVLLVAIEPILGAGLKCELKVVFAGAHRKISGWNINDDHVVHQPHLDGSTIWLHRGTPTEKKDH